ncbi:hypothetical protein RUND412_001969 [Rhizina undulata]
MSMNRTLVAASFVTRVCYIEEALRDLLQSTSMLRSQILTPPPHHWTTVTLFKNASVACMREITRLRQLVATLLSEEAQILEAHGNQEYPTNDKRVEAMEKFNGLMEIQNTLDVENGVMTVIGEIVRWHVDNRGKGKVDQFGDFLDEELIPGGENLDPRSVEYVLQLLAVAVANGIWTEN